MIESEIKEKIIQMRLDGFTWREIKEKFNLSPNAQTGIYKAKWFLRGTKAAKEKRKGKEKKKEDIKESENATVDKPKTEAKKTVDKEIEKHIKSSDKAPANIKKKETVASEKGKETEKKKEEKKEKSSFGLWAILIIALVIGVVMIIFLLKGKKTEVKEPEEQKPKSRGFEGRSIDTL